MMRPGTVNMTDLILETVERTIEFQIKISNDECYGEGGTWLSNCGHLKFRGPRTVGHSLAAATLMQKYKHTAMIVGSTGMKRYKCELIPQEKHKDIYVANEFWRVGSRDFNLLQQTPYEIIIIDGASYIEDMALRQAPTSNKYVELIDNIYTKYTMEEKQDKDTRLKILIELQ